MTEADEPFEASAASEAMAQATSRAEAMALAEEAEAEAAEAEAMAAAARARARAARLRREAMTLAEAAEDYGDAAAAAADADYDDEDYETADEDYDEEYDEEYEEEYEEAVAEGQGEAAPPPATRLDGWRRRLPSSTATAKVAAVLLIIGFAAFSTYAVLHHRDTVRYQQRQAAFIAGAKQGVTNMISLDYTKAQADVQRVIDSSTGEFKDDFKNRAKDFIAVVEQSKAVTDGTINRAAVESMKGGSAVVLVSATSRVTNSPPGKDQPPRMWRLRVTIADVGGQYKMSKVEYVP
jgi:Mce-associated membrane protein